MEKKRKREREKERKRERRNKKEHLERRLVQVHDGTRLYQYCKITLEMILHVYMCLVWISCKTEPIELWYIYDGEKYREAINYPLSNAIKMLQTHQTPLFFE
jgi:hypothetical protein